MIYLVVSAISLALMVIVYRLALSRTTFHGFNRYVLLSSLALAAVLPLIHLQGLGVKAAGPVAYMLNEITVFADGSTRIAPAAAQTANGVGIVSILTLVWLAGVAVCLMRVAIGIVSSEIICHHRSRRLSDGSRLVITGRDYAPFSWRNFIVISRKDYESNGDIIIAHEQAHIRLHHSVDLILAQLFCAVQWFNPAAWMLKRSLLEVHEYEADASVLERGFDECRYQICLVRAALQGRFAVTTNNFANCSTKKRIVMMKRISTNPWARMRVLLMLPAAAFAIVMASACKSDESESPVKSQDGLSGQESVEVLPNGQNTQDLILNLPGVEMDADGNITVNGKKVSRILINGQELDEKNLPAAGSDERRALERAAEVLGSVDGEKNASDADDDVFMVVEEMPEFPGGTDALLEYLRTNLKYPDECKENNIQGRVLVSFVVNKTGEIINAEVVKSVNELLDAEALRVVNSMPVWKPGKQRGEVVRVKYVVPVTFRMN
ncbi:MAG: M56 family metallopeptidase [Bacteroidaceae bacterium]|nr:M56 family metallopeptidase [Bacteroidaceae bacterium]